MSAVLTPAEVVLVRRTIAAARAGRAPLADVAAARDLCLRAELPGCAEELRGHALRALSPGPAPRSAGRDVLLGVATGALTHYLMKGI
jgi:hypothetical protein